MIPLPPTIGHLHSNGEFCPENMPVGPDGLWPVDLISAKDAEAHAAACVAAERARTEVLARWVAEALGVLADVDADAEDGGEALRMFRARGDRLVAAVLTPGIRTGDKP